MAGSVDTLFRSAAREADGGTIGIVLSGMLDDGAYGLRVIARGGGVGLVQDPETAAFPGMPQAAIEAGGASCVLPLQDIAERLSDVPALLAEHSADRGGNGRRRSEDERRGEPSSYICPNCGGALWEHDDDRLLRFRCRTGHAHSPESLLDVQAAALDDALWGAYRALLERAEVAARLAGRFAERDLSRSAERWADIGDEAQRRASLLREVLSNDGPMPAVGGAHAARPGEHLSG